MKQNPAQNLQKKDKWFKFTCYNSKKEARIFYNTKLGVAAAIIHKE